MTRLLPGKRRGINHRDVICESRGKAIFELTYSNSPDIVFQFAISHDQVRIMDDYRATVTTRVEVAVGEREKFKRELTIAEHEEKLSGAPAVQNRHS